MYGSNMGMCLYLFHYVVLVAVVFWPHTAHALNSTEHEIIWQFQREIDGVVVSLSGDTLERQLPPINIVVGDTVRFVWGGFSELHGLYQTTSQTEFVTCTTGSGTVLQLNIVGNVSVTLG